MTYQKVLEYCDKRNLSIYAFEQECGIGNGTIGAWKNGSLPSLKTLKKIAEFTGMTISELVESDA